MCLFVFCIYWGNPLWISTGRTDAEGEAPILRPWDSKSWLIGKDPDAGKDWSQKEKGAAEDETVGQHHWPNGHKFEQTLGDRGGQRSLVRCSPWGYRVGHDLATEQQQSFLSCGMSGQLLSEPVFACAVVRDDGASAEKVTSHRREDVEGSLTMAPGLCHPRAFFSRTCHQPTADRIPSFVYMSASV